MSSDSLADNFIQMINAVECELKLEHMPGAFEWMDSEKDFAFSKCIERLQAAIDTYVVTGQEEKLKKEIEFYKNRMLELLKEYKTKNNIDEQSEFLESLKRG